MNDKRLIILGVDGMDFKYTQSILDKLPHIKRLSETGYFVPFRSVFPPDSIPSWITAYTGKDPSEHGVLESVDYISKKTGTSNVDNSVFKEKTFWDILGRNNIEVCVINPFMAYPVWDVNGIMISGPVFISGDIQCSAPERLGGLEVPRTLGGIVDFPTKKNLDEFCAKAFQDTKDQIDFGLKLLQKTQPGLFFQVLLTMDRLKHFLWRYCDETDPTHPGKNQFENMIEEFYQLIDDGIGKFLDLLNPEDRFMVISDHGHGMRCTHCFNINEFFRRKGYVKSKAEGKFFSKQIILEKLKNKFLKFMNDHDLEDYIGIVAKFVPNAKAIKKGKHITESEKNIAYASDFTGTNPFGGICINRELVDDYDHFRKDVIEELRNLQHDGRPVFDWLRPREELFDGPYLDKFPDILFEMAPYLGVNWALHTDVFTVNPTHKKISGGHNKTGVLLINDSGTAEVISERSRMENLFPTILDFFQVDSGSLCRGKSFLRLKR